MKNRGWLMFALATMGFWGLWGAVAEMPEKVGFPATLGYCVWALTMIPPALVALHMIGWKLERDRRSILLGSIIGVTGAGGQLILFKALTLGPAYLVFPIVALSPVVTIVFSYVLLKERATKWGWIGIVLATAAVPLLSFSSPVGSEARSGVLWVILVLLVLLAWGFQAGVMKLANATMTAEGIFCYMMLSGLALIPFAVGMTDLSRPINWGLNGPWLATAIHLLNSVGALCLVHALRHGRAMIISPLVNAGAPLLTIALSLAINRAVPHPVIVAGMALALVAAVLLTLEPPESGSARSGAFGETIS